jgi:hypothetical protein
MSNNNTTTNESSPPKIKVHFVPVGNAPLLKKSKFLISSTDEFGVATIFLRKLLKLTSDTTSLGKNSGLEIIPVSSIRKF